MRRDPLSVSRRPVTDHGLRLTDYRIADHGVPPRPVLAATVLWLMATPWLLFAGEVAPVATALAAVALLNIPLLLWQAGEHFLPATPLDRYLLVLLVFTVLGFLVSPLPQVSLPKLLIILLGVTGYYLAQLWLRSSQEVVALLSLLSLAGGAIVLIGLFTLQWPERQLLDVAPLVNWLPHLSGDFYVHHNEMAGALAPLLPLAIGGWRLSAGRRRLGMAGLVFVIAFGLLLTQSRSALLGLVAAGAFSLVWHRPRPLIAGAFAMGGLMLLLLAWRGAPLEDFSSQVAALDASMKQGTSNVGSWETRLEIWRAAGRMAGDYAVVGAGLYTFDPVSRLNYPYSLVEPHVTIAHAHNLALQTATSGGWPGLLALLLLWAALLAGLLRAGQSPVDQYAHLARLFSASILAYLFFNLFDVLMLGQKPAVLFWLLIAGAVAVIRLAGDGRPPAEPSGRGLLSHIWLAPVVLLIIMILTPAWPRNLANLQLDRMRLGGRAVPVPQYDQFQGDERRQGLLAYWQGDKTTALSFWRQDSEAVPFLESQGRLADEGGAPEVALAWYELARALDVGGE